MKREKSFTLIELLIVMAIIGILAAMAFVNLSSARKKARMAAGKESVMSVMSAMTLCLDGKGTVQIPPSSNTNTTTDICSITRVASAKYPSLSNSGWQWGSLSGTPDSTNVAITASCSDAVCGGGGITATVRTSGVTYSPWISTAFEIASHTPDSPISPAAGVGTQTFTITLNNGPAATITWRQNNGAPTCSGNPSCFLTHTGQNQDTVVVTATKSGTTSTFTWIWNAPPAPD